ncbi:hypothetical protein [Aeromonas media]|uniref:hypothetical protein n=1 Tax=Aeromonas media TaxID=651 RepID=UPI003D1F246D
MARKKRYISKPPINNRMTSPPATTTTQLNTDPLNNTAQRQHDCSQTLPEQAFPPISSKVMFWRPRYLAQSQWLQHVPFYFWLTEVLEPKLVVEPCVNSAVGYFAICQAIDKLNLDGVICGALGAQCDGKRVLTYNYDHYREFSSLIAEDETTFLSGFADHSIDLLILKHDSPLLANEAGLASVEQRVSSHGVVLIHGSTLSALRDKHHDWRSRYLSFELTLASGLLLLCMGPQVPSRLQALINQSREPSGQRVIHNIYSRLGAASEDNWHRVSQQQQLQQLREALKIADDKQADLTRQLQLQQQQAAAALNGVIAERDNLQAANSQLGTQLKQQNAKHEKHEQALQQDLQTRFDELATLTQLLVTAEAASESQRQANQEAAVTIAAITAERDGLQMANRQLKEAEQQWQRQQQQNVAAALNKVTAERDSLQASNRQLKEYQKQIEQQLQNLSTELARLTEHNAMLERDQAVAAERIATLTHSELALQQSLAERFDELATLTNLLVEAEQGHQHKLAEKPLAQPGPLTESHTQVAQDRSGVGSRLRAKLAAVKPRKGQAQLAKKVALIRESELFDEAWYLQQHPEAASHHYGAAGHYLEVGAAKGSNPSPRFDGNAYWQTNQDVKQAGMNPLYHFLKFGFAEARLIKPM